MLCRACRGAFSRERFLEALPPWWRDDPTARSIVPARHCPRWACFLELVAWELEHGEAAWAAFCEHEQQQGVAWALRQADRREETIEADRRYL